MNPSRMIEIAAQLGQAYTFKAEKAISLANANRDLEVRMLVITPAEGWPGKNAEERKLAQERGATEDKDIEALRGIIRERENELTAIQAGIDSLEAERRALEWEVRATLATALSGKQEVHGQVEVHAFDDAMDAGSVDVALLDSVEEDRPF